MGTFQVELANNMMNPLPLIDQSLCTGCHACVDSCPTQALGQRDGKAFLERPLLCTYCTACEDICPEGAIALPFLIVMAPRAVH
jgi:ferredoxin